jgi:hypothetical protein
MHYVSLLLLLLFILTADGFLTGVSGFYLVAVALSSVE